VDLLCSFSICCGQVESHTPLFRFVVDLLRICCTAFRFVVNFSISYGLVVGYEKVHNLICIESDLDLFLYKMAIIADKIDLCDAVIVCNSIYIV
jgi:hypothetical protein